MSKMKQIDEELLFDLIKFHVLAREEGLEQLFWNAEFEETLYTRLKKKWEAWQKQEAFTKYKTSGNKEERETARQKYLDLQRYHKDFRR